ncbi:hypothetical protein [Methylomicrobium sp. Wu6]|uniref:hypothetical protein n=1 Tax=Methylomicrobium sp. Wu6 TaxID=3107928 RepID=UPI002DD6544D|nr:hypothetical protein [Methylomicrobium sp. Wu6]MEC4747050.1 hypothetical protein [Methylomicrobium sp. Wu6]
MKKPNMRLLKSIFLTFSYPHCHERKTLIKHLKHRPLMTLPLACLPFNHTDGTNAAIAGRLHG